MWGISGVCTLALTVTKTSSCYNRFAISVPARSLLLVDVAQQEGNISGPKAPRGTRWNGEKSEARFILSSKFEHRDSNLVWFLENLYLCVRTYTVPPFVRPAVDSLEVEVGHHDNFLGGLFFLFFFEINIAFVENMSLWTLLLSQL